MREHTHTRLETGRRGDEIGCLSNKSQKSAAIARTEPEEFDADLDEEQDQEGKINRVEDEFDP